MHMASKGGPKPQPSNVRVLRGGKAKSGEPVPPSGEVEPPEVVSGEALEIWNDYAPSLTQRGLLTPWNRDTFAIFVCAVANWRQAQMLTQQSGVVVVQSTPSGGRRTVKNPALQVVRDQAQTALRAAAEFGLTPSSLSQVELVPQEQVSELHSILNS